MTSIFSQSLRIVSQSLLVLLILLPADVAVMSSGNEHEPLLLWNGSDDKATFHGFPAVGSAVDESTSVSWIVQNPQCVTVLEWNPYQVPFSGAGV